MKKIEKVINDRIIEYNMLRLFVEKDDPQATGWFDEIIQLIHDNIPLIEQPKYLQQIKV